MKRYPATLVGRLALTFALVGLGGCSTIKYRAVQSEFEEAVRADNDQSDLPFTDTANRYAAVANELTPAYIAGLDERLQPNAWTLRAVSEWRAGQFTNAVQSVQDGLRAIEQLGQKEPKLEASRDSVVLTMIPGLVEDSRLRQRLKDQGPPDVAAHYDDYANKFHNALRSLAEAKARMTPATPGAVRYYWFFQCWRVLENWEFVLAKLPLDRQAEANRAADDFVKATLGGKDFLDAATLPAAVTNAENGIPANHVYRKLIDLERQR